MVPSLPLPPAFCFYLTSEELGEVEAFLCRTGAQPPADISAYHTSSPPPSTTLPAPSLSNARLLLPFCRAASRGKWTENERGAKSAHHDGGHCSFITRSTPYHRGGGAASLSSAPQPLRAAPAMSKELFSISPEAHGGAAWDARGEAWAMISRGGTLAKAL